MQKLNKSGFDNIDRWIPLVERAAARHDIDPTIMLSILKVESSGKPQAVRQEQHLTLKLAEKDPKLLDAIGGFVASSGLFQVLNQTASELKGRPVTVTELFDPVLNADLAGKYLARQKKRFNGNEILYIASYNAGTPRDDNTGEFIRSDENYKPGTPLKNQSYVNKVLEFRAKLI